MPITAYYKNDNSLREIPTLQTIFPGGEPHVEIQEFNNHRDIVIDARIGSMDDFMTTLVLADALRQLTPATLSLVMPYFPGARQDRRESGFSLSAKVFAGIINAQGFTSVSIMDPHSPVTPALLDRCRVMDHQPYVLEFLKHNKIDGLICPDLGAQVRVAETARLAKLPVVQAYKHRDPQTGKLSSFSCDPLPFAGNWAVVDDICDGGGTFLGLAEQARKRVTDLFLWTTHGIHSQGLSALSMSYKVIGCTDSFPTGFLGATKIKAQNHDY